MARFARRAGRGRNARFANVDLNRNLVGADARNATGNRVRDFRRDEFAAGNFAFELNRFHHRRFDATGANFRNHFANFVVDGAVNRFRDVFANFVVDGADALLRNHLADGVVANFRFRNHLADFVVHRADAGLRNHLADGVIANASFRDHLANFVVDGADALLRNHLANGVVANFRFRNHLADFVVHRADAGLRNHLADGVIANASFRDCLANFIGNRADAGLRNHTRALDFLHDGLRNPNFAFAGRRRALHLADFVFDRTARVARIAARDAAKDRFARNRNAFGLPAAALNRNLFRIGLRNANGVRNLLLAFDPSRFADGVLALTLFVNRLADGVRDLLLTRFPNRLADGVLTLALFVNRLADGVRDLLLAVLPNRAVHRAGDRLLAVFPNRLADGVLNFANASFRNVLRAKNAARNRNFLERRPIANDLLLLVHDFAAGLHHRAALRREFASARSAPTIRRRAAPSGLRLFKRRSQQSRREQ